MVYSLLVKEFSGKEFKTVVAGPVFPSTSKKSDLELVRERRRKKIAAV